MTGIFFDFTFPEELAREPKIYSLARRYNIQRDNKGPQRSYKHPSSETCLR